MFNHAGEIISEKHVCRRPYGYHVFSTEAFNPAPKAGLEALALIFIHIGILYPG
jgi:hypothetical protein